MTETVWQCEAMRAGQLYSRFLFQTREEAEEFAAKMEQAQPDQMFRIEPVEAKQLWN